jgi:hypothetical protein
MVNDFKLGTWGGSAVGRKQQTVTLVDSLLAQMRLRAMA